jgi:hypothetical protein
MAERVRAIRIVASGRDAVPEWFSVSFEEVTGLQSGNRNLQLVIPTGVALDLALRIRKQLRQSPAGSAQ